MLRNKISSLQTSVNLVCSTALSIFPQMISKPCIRIYKNHSKASSGAGDSPKIFVHVKSHNSINVIVNQEDIINSTLSCIVNCDTKRHRPMFHMLVWRLRAWTRIKLKYIFLVGEIEWFVLSIFVKMLLVMDLQEWNAFSTLWWTRPM